MLFETIPMTMYAVNFLRNPQARGYGVEDPLIPDLPDDAQVRICLPSGWFTVVWQQGDTLFEFDPQTRLRCNRGLSEDSVWTEWQ